MLVLTRKVGEKIHIGDGITVTVLDVKGARVRIGIDAPGDIRIVRGELLEFAEAGSAKELEPETVC
jgi:carbon storage regulator